MNTNKCTIWQVAAGSSDRSYIEQFLDYGVALIGPGDLGSWPNKNYDEHHERRFIQRFATELCEGDVLLLRKGRSVIQAVGLVASEYMHLPQFDDVNGWDLQHGRRVRWCRLPEPHDFGWAVFGGNPRRLSRVAKEEAVEYATRFVQSSPTEWQTRALPNLPNEEAKLESPPSELQDLIAQVWDMSARHWDSDDFGELPMESEMIAHYVVPFLRCLGWPVENIAVEWRRADVSVFSKLPRTPENCSFLIEVKRIDKGIEGAFDQAKGYTSNIGVQRDVVVTDGIRYRMYDASSDSPVAYANLARLKQSSLDLFNRMNALNRRK